MPGVGMRSFMMQGLSQFCPTWYKMPCAVLGELLALLQLIHLSELWLRVEISIFSLQAWIICLSSA